MIIFFDTEFTGLVPNTTLISIGMVAETGEKFYAEFTDYNYDLCDKWIVENVLKNLFLKRNPNSPSALVDYKQDDHAYVKGDSTRVLKYLRDWLLDINKNSEHIQFVSDVCHYDFYLLCNLFGGAIKLPTYINPVCYDICQDIAMLHHVASFEVLWEPTADPDDMKFSFDISREEFCKKLTGKLPEGQKHNALYDAEVIKMIYEGIHN